jgi:hypothetical protein
MPGVYADDEGGMHVDIPELLAARGYPDTPQNRETLIKAAVDIGLELGLPVDIVEGPAKRPPPPRKGTWRNYG